MYSHEGNYLLSDNGIISVQNTEVLLETMALNYGVSVKTVVELIEGEEVGVFVETPLGFTRKTVLVDPKTLAPYCILRKRRCKQRKFIFVNPSFSRAVINEFWMSNPEDGPPETVNNA